MKSLQPDCLLTDHTHLQDPWEVDIVNFEEPRGAFVSGGNTYAGNQEQKINASGGNDWFWSPNIGGLMTRDRHRRQPPEGAGAAVDELPAQLPAQPEGADGRRDRHAAG